MYNYHTLSPQILQLFSRFGFQRVREFSSYLEILLFLFLCSTETISEEIENLITKGINWDKLFNIFKDHELLPLAYERLKELKLLIPTHIYGQLKATYYYNLSHNIRLQEEFFKIAEMLYQNNMPALPIKGMDILCRFPEENRTRAMVDIDILIKYENFKQTEKILLGLGYQKNLLGLKEEYWREKQCHIEFDKGAFIVEVHWGLDFKRPERTILPLLWKRVKKVNLENHEIDILSQEDALFAFALHLRRFGRILSLKQVMDVARIIKNHPEFDWNYILKESKKGRMQATVYFILMQAFLFTETPIPLEIFKKLNIPSWQRKLIKKFILKSTFKIQPSMKKDYFNAHLLLYDNPWEPFWYLINIPYEQFCKFYNLKPYTNKSELFYKMRLLYMPIKQIFLSKESFQ